MDSRINSCVLDLCCGDVLIVMDERVNVLVLYELKKNGVTGVCLCFVMICARRRP